MPFRATSRRLRHTILGVVLLALALAQTLGAVHRIVHSPLSAPAVGSDWSARSGSTWLQALFAGHGNEQGCDLYDQLSHADLIQVAVAAVVLLQPVAARDSVPVASQLAALLPGFRARGPPPTA